MRNSIEYYFDRLFPINRSLTGNGNRETLKMLSELVDLKIYEVPSGTNCFDWTVPSEWNVKEAWVKNSKGEKVIDFEKSNLHLLGYSEPFKGKLSLGELKQHLHSLPNQPDLIPYMTSYYKKRWGFCITHTQLESLPEDEYEVLIDSSLDEAGSMTYGEAFIEGEQKEEIFLSTYICHPSLANNELSGPLVTAHLYKELKKRKKPRYSYRFIFIPETIGSIYYLSVNGEDLRKKMIAGYVVTCIGDNGPFTYKRSRRKNTITDRAAELILKQTETDYKIYDFFPTGSDERQYCSPGFNLPVGSLMRTMYGKYPEYHTSADNRDFISFAAMEESVNKYLKIIDVIENNYTYINTIPYCEPQLGKRGLYPTLGSQKGMADFTKCMMWLLNYADGEHDILDIAKLSSLPIESFFNVANNLREKGVLKIKYEKN